MSELTVWDYVKALLTFQRDRIPQIPLLPENGQQKPAVLQAELEPYPLEENTDQRELVSAPVYEASADLTAENPAAVVQAEYRTVPQVVRARVPVADMPWFTAGALFLALIAQRSLEPGVARSWKAGLFLYVLALIFGAVALFRKEWLAAEPREQESSTAFPTIHWPWLMVSLPLMLGAFILFGGVEPNDHRFTFLNTVLWIGSIYAIVKAFLPGSWLNGLRKLRGLRSLQIKLTPFALLFLAVLGLAIFYRIHQLAAVPAEMNSDHAEKLLDVFDVLEGRYYTYFPRNTGREALQFYLTALVAKLFGTGISFMSLKIGTVFAGLLTLPFIYLLGKEVGNRRVGLIAMFLAGIAYWPNVLSRIALRFSLYPLFVAPALYFLVRGLRRSSVRDFVFAGIALGIGLHGYTPFRIVPFLVVAAVVIFILHRQSSADRQVAVYGLLIVALVSLVVALPLLRYAADYPDMFAFRAITRVGTVEQGYPAPVWQIFLSNTWRAMIMPAWDDGSIWAVSVTYRPVLDVASAALFYLGYGLLIVRYALKRHWQDLFLVLAVPMLMLPSILSLAFPAENPAPNRAGGALVVIFVVAALALDGILTSFRNRFSPSAGNVIAVSTAVILVGLSMAQNYDLVFHQYKEQYNAGAWNSSEMGQVIGDFTRSFGTPDSAWVVAYPYWVDTRLVGMTAGYPTKDYAIAADNLAKTQEVKGAKMFIINKEDALSIANLQVMYPRGWMVEYPSKYPNKNFWTFFVPPDAGAALP